MTRTGLAVALMLPVVLAACQKTPPPPPQPVLTGPEAACAARGAATAGVDVSTVTVTPASSTKTGEPIYSVVANGVGYNCVVGLDGAVQSFTPQ